MRWTGRCSGHSTADAEIHAGANFHGNNVIFGSHDSNLYCLSPDGKKVWATAVDGPINAAAAIVGDRTFATGCSDGILHVIDAKNGKELGTLDLRGQTIATAAVVGDRLYASMVSNQVVAADLKTLKKLWAFEAREAAAALPLLAGRGGAASSSPGAATRRSTPSMPRPAEKLELHDRGAGGRLAGHRRRTGLCRHVCRTTATSTSST